MTGSGNRFREVVFIDHRAIFLRHVFLDMRTLFRIEFQPDSLTKGLAGENDRHGKCRERGDPGRENHASTRTPGQPQDGDNPDHAEDHGSHP